MSELKSQIQAELADATDVQPSARRDETITTQSYMTRVAQEVAKLSDAEWAKLTTAAQTWYNQAADAIDAKKDVPEWPDLPKEEAEPTTSRRRSSKAEESAPAAKKDAEVGDEVKVVTKRGKVYEGKLVEIDEKDNLIVVETEDNPKGEELNRDRIESIEVVGGASGGKSEASSKPYTVDDVAEGDEVELTNKRGKAFAGKVTEVTKTDIVLKTDDGVEEVLKDRVDTIKLIGAGHVDKTTSGRGSKKEDKAVEPEEPARRGRGAAKAADKAPAEDKGKPVTLRLRELICENPDAKKEQISKLAKEEGIEFKDGTLDIAFNDTSKIIGILRGLGWKAGR